jgi:hypothetical protein
LIVKGGENSSLEDKETSRESRESKEGSVAIHLAKGIFKDVKLSVFR